MAPSPTEHRASALELLDRSRQYGYTSPARLALVAEAQVEATLALSAAPRFIVPELPAEEVEKLAAGRLMVLPDTPVPAFGDTEAAQALMNAGATPPPEKPAPKRRTRKPKTEAAPAAEEAATEEASA
jgi:hypothetical protein